MSPRNNPISSPENSQAIASRDEAEILLAKVDLLHRLLQKAISQQGGASVETFALQQQIQALEPEIQRIRAELLQTRQEIESLKRISAQESGDSVCSDAILALIVERRDPSLRRIATSFGLAEDEARCLMTDLQAAGLVTPLNLLNGVQRWILTKKGMSHLEAQGLPHRAFRKKAPSRVYW